MANTNVNMGGVNKKIRFQETFSNWSAMILLPVSYALRTANENSAVPTFSPISETGIEKMVGAQVCHRYKEWGRRDEARQCWCWWHPGESSWVWGTCCGCQGSGGAWSSGEGFWRVFTACCDMLLRVFCSVRTEQWQLCYSGSNTADPKSVLASLLLLLLFCYFLPVALWQQTFVIQPFSVGTIFSTRAVERNEHSAATAGFCCLQSLKTMMCNVVRTYRKLGKGEEEVSCSFVVDLCQEAHKPLS